MSTPLERYRKRLKANAPTISQARRQSAIDINNRAFEYADGYKSGYVMTRDIPDGGYSDWQEYDFLIKHTLTETEKKIITRPNTTIPTGSYIKYVVTTENKKPNGEVVKEERESIMIIRGRILDDEVMPSFRAFICEDTLRLKGCPYEFPIYGFNSTYSSKGMIDSDQVSTIDSRNKIYLQKNKYTIRLYEKHKNYRIILGDEETKYQYFITEMDDISYPGMFIVSLKTDEKHPNDEGFYAYNPVDIRFDDIVEESGNEDVAEPIISCDSYLKLGVEVEVECNKSIEEWTVNEQYFTVASTSDKSITLTPIKTGLTSIQATDKDGIQASKNIVIKG